MAFSAHTFCCFIHKTFCWPVAWQETRTASPRHVAGTMYCTLSL